MWRRVVLGILSFGLSCSESRTSPTASKQQPNARCIPGPGFAQTVRITSSKGDRATVRVGEALTLYATRRSGPWKLVSAAIDGECAWPHHPPVVEREVAGNLSWELTPPGLGEFDHDNPGQNATRTVTFSAPGTFELKGTSAVWCLPRYPSNSIYITVEK